jgi:hypothetical protein
MTKVSDETWKKLVDRANDGIAQWNVKALTHNRPDRFLCHEQPTEKYVILFTEQFDRHSRTRKAVAREIATGNLVKIQSVAKGWKISEPPKAWANLGDDDFEKLWKALKLTNYIMFISSGITGAYDAIEEVA